MWARKHYTTKTASRDSASSIWAPWSRPGTQRDDDVATTAADSVGDGQVSTGQPADPMSTVWRYGSTGC